jgi:lipopolysaccharide export LptBFGC system permease protein LptF
MNLIDRYIISRFLVNFLLLFVVLFIFAAAIDLILNLDEFVEVAREAVGPEGGLISFFANLVRLALNFQGPRLFQFYSYLHGLIAIGAMGFTLGQMYREKELVAMMASGVSLFRVGTPLVVGMLLLCLVQLINQEFTLPRVAPLILRGHTEVGQHGVDEFDVTLTRDGNGSLLQAARFYPTEARLVRPTFIVRDEQGRTLERVVAKSASWDEQSGGWRLEGGLSMRHEVAQSVEGGSTARDTVDLYRTDLDPQALLLRRYGEYGAMLSLSQLGELIDSPDVVDVAALQRYRFARFAAVLLNIQVLLLTLPSFLIREPTSLLRQSMICAVIGLPVMLLSLVMMSVSVPGVSPVVSVYLPVIVLFPLVLARMMYVKT